MTGLRKIGLFLVIIFLVIQFIQPVRNVSTGTDDDDISRTYLMPPIVHRTLAEKCYDCHSNNTRYSWYFSIQPIGWWLASRVYEGKARLNFSDFKKYSADQARQKLERIVGITDGGSLHLKSYSLLYPGLQINREDARAIHAWVQTRLTATD
ncbi:MAG TPA: heme-binding domain-containing protein [Chryseosolibacter sp.]